MAYQVCPNNYPRLTLTCFKSYKTIIHTICKYIRSKLTFVLSSKIAHVGLYILTFHSSHKAI